MGLGGGRGVGSRYLVFQDKLRPSHDKPVVSLYAPIFLTLAEAFFLLVRREDSSSSYIHTFMLVRTLTMPYLSLQQISLFLQILCSNLDSFIVLGWICEVGSAPGWSSLIRQIAIIIYRGPT